MFGLQHAVYQWTYVIPYVANNCGVFHDLCLNYSSNEVRVYFPSPLRQPNELWDLRIWFFLLYEHIRYTYWQVWAVLVVLAGAILCLFADSSKSDGGLGGSSFFFAIVMAVSTLPNALSFTLKEYIFSVRVRKSFMPRFFFPVLIETGQFSLRFHMLGTDAQL
jgi:hypothetical protein